MTRIILTLLLLTSPVYAGIDFAMIARELPRLEGVKEAIELAYELRKDKQAAERLMYRLRKLASAKVVAYDEDDYVKFEEESKQYDWYTEVYARWSYYHSQWEKLEPPKELPIFKDKKEADMWIDKYAGKAGVQELIDDRIRKLEPIASLEGYPEGVLPTAEQIELSNTAEKQIELLTDMRGYSAVFMASSVPVH